MSASLAGVACPLCVCGMHTGPSTKCGHWNNTGESLTLVIKDKVEFAG